MRTQTVFQQIANRLPASWHDWIWNRCRLYRRYWGIGIRLDRGEK
jgi:hypothetical protein